MIEKALELAQKKAQTAEVGASSGYAVSASYEDDKLKKVNVSQNTSLRVRVIVEGKVGSAHTTDPDDYANVVEKAVALAQFGSEAKFDFPANGAAQKVAIYDPEIEKISKAELVGMGAEMLEMVKAYNPEIKISAAASWSVGEWRLINSSGLDVRDKGSRHGADVFGVLVRGTDMLMAGDSKSWRTRDVAPKALADRAIQHFRWAEKTVPIATKKMPVIFTPRGASLLLMALELGIDGKNVLKGDSPLAGRISEKIASEKFSLIDDGTIDFALSSGAYDGEGVPRKRLEIIKDGVLQAFLYDLQTAGKAGTKSTGHGPGCAISNLMILPGATSFAKMLADTQEGLLVEHVMGAGQSNIMNGDFSVNLSLAYKIENGEIVGRVKDTMLAGNVYDALNAIEIIGSDNEWVYQTNVPSVKIGGLSVVAKK